MSRRIDRARTARRTSGRQAGTLAGGRGDPRDHRREAQRLTDQDLDPAYLRVLNGQLTLVGDNLIALLEQEGLVGAGLELDGSKRLSISLGAGLALDRKGRVSVQFNSLDVLTDETGGTASTSATLEAIADPANAPASADALRDDLVANVLPEIRNALATLANHINLLRGGT